MGCNCGGSARNHVQPALRDVREGERKPKRERRAATAPLEPGWDPAKRAYQGPPNDGRK